jgi:hypothetical protein
VHEKFRVFGVQGFEKREPHQMIPVRMGKNEMVFTDIFFHQVVAQSANACSGIHDDDIAALGLNFHTGCIAAVF